MGGNWIWMFATSIAVLSSQHHTAYYEREVGKWISRRETEAATIWATGSWVNATYVPAFGRPAAAAELACSSKSLPASVLFPPDLQGHDCLPTGLAALLINGNGTTQTLEGSNGGRCTLQQQRLDVVNPACFKTFGTCNLLPRNLATHTRHLSHPKYRWNTFDPPCIA